MAILAITATNVALVSGDADQIIAGEAMTPGQVAYYNDVDARWYKAKSNGTALEAGSQGLGMALAQAVGAGNRIGLAKPGAVVALGAGVAGTGYWLGSTAGGLFLSSDLTSTHKATLAAIGIGTNQVMLTRVYNGGAVLP